MEALQYTWSVDHIVWIAKQTNVDVLGQLGIERELIEQVYQILRWHSVLLKTILEGKLEDSQGRGQWCYKWEDNIERKTNDNLLECATKILEIHFSQPLAQFCCILAGYKCTMIFKYSAVQATVYWICNIKESWQYEHRQRKIGHLSLVRNWVSRDVCYKSITIILGKIKINSA